MIANLEYAAKAKQSAWIGGGEFSPAELADAARKLEAFDELLNASKAVTGMVELFLDELRIKEMDGYNRGSKEGMAKLEALRAAIAKGAAA